MEGRIEQKRENENEMREERKKIEGRKSSKMM